MGTLSDQALPEHQLTAIIARLPDPLIVIDAGNQVLEWNKSAEAMFGWARQEVLGRSLSKILIPADQRAAHEQGLQHFLAVGPRSTMPHRFEVPALRRDGTSIPVELAIVPIPYGATWIFSATLHDLTARKHHEAALKSSEQRYRSLFDFNPNAVYSFDLEGRFLSANDRLEALTGYTRAEIRNMSFLPIVAPERREQVLHHFREAARGQPQIYETTGRRKDGQLFDVRVINIPIVVDDRIVGVYGIAIDLTECRRAEQALQDSRHQLELAITAANLCVYEWDVASGDVRLSGNTAMIEGPEAKQPMRSFAAYLERIPAEERKSVEQVIRHSLLADGQVQLEHRFIGPDGTIRWLLILGIGLPGPTGRIDRKMGVINDVTGRKQAEQAVHRLAAHVQAAREADRARIAREVHDELGGLLAAIRFAVAAFPNHPVDSGTVPEHREAIDLIDQAIQTFRRIIDGLRPSLLDDLGLWPALEWQARHFGEQTGITVDFDGPETEVPVESELATGVYRIFEELLANIRQHAGATETKIRVHTTPEWIRLQVSDNGKGITREQMLSSESLGLLGIHERARYFGGRAEFSGVPGQGTTVTLDVPVHQPQPSV